MVENDHREQHKIETEMIHVEQHVTTTITLTKLRIKNAVIALDDYYYCAVIIRSSSYGIAYSLTKFVCFFGGE